MAFNPLDRKRLAAEERFHNWSELNVNPYTKRDVDRSLHARPGRLDDLYCSVT